MCGGFGGLAMQGFLTAFPARESRRDERETLQISEKDATGGLFRQLMHGMFISSEVAQ